MKKFIALCAILGTLCSLTACSQGTANPSDTSSITESADTTTSTGLKEATPEIGDPATVAEHYEILRNAKLGDKIEFNDYLYSIADGCKTYYIHGRYVITSENVVMQTRDEIEVADVSTPIGDIIALDPNFDVEKATVSFYGSDGVAVAGSLEQTLSATVTDCVVEYADWLNEDKTYGAVQSYLFTYGYVPVKICGYYDASAETSTNTGTTETATEGTEGTESTEATESNADTSTSVTE